MFKQLLVHSDSSEDTTGPGLRHIWGIGSRNLGLRLKASSSSHSSYHSVWRNLVVVGAKTIFGTFFMKAQ